MTSLQVTVRRYLTPILLLLLAGGYLVILAELFLYQHWAGVQFIGFAATVIGLLAVLAGLVAKRGLRVGLAILLAIVSISGLIGTYEHYESRAEEGGEAARPVLVQSAAANLAIVYQPAGSERTAAQEEGESGEGAEAGEGGERGSEEVPPPLAPLSLAGLSLMGAAVLLAKQDANPVTA